MLMIHVMVLEGHFTHKWMIVEHVTEGKNAMNLPDRVYGLYLLTVRTQMVF